MARRRSFWQWLTSIRRQPLRGITSTRALAGGRITYDANRPLFAGASIIQPPPDHESDWRMLNLDSKTLDRMEPARLLELLADLSPEVSKAFWDFLRNCNPGWTAQAFPPGTDRADERAETDPIAQAALDAFLGELRTLYGAADVVWNKLYSGAFLRGAFFGELVLDARGRMPVDIAVPDAKTVRFRMVDDPVRGQVWVPGQWQNGKFVEFTRPTVRYIAVDPMPGVPYGRPLVSPALFSSLFLLGMLHDLRRVVQQQGYPRLDIAIDIEKLDAMFKMARPLDSTGAALTFDAFAKSIVEQVRTTYAALEPDDAYIHTDSIIVNRPVGTVDADSLGAIDGLIEALERMSVRALKTMPFAFGLSESTTETQANRQYDLYTAGIKSLQHYAENLLEHFLSLALEAQGIQASVRFRFAQLRASERIREAQADAMEIANESAKYQHGWVTQDEASEAVTGHAAAMPGPVQQAAVVAAPSAQTNGASSRFVPNGTGAAVERMNGNGNHA